MFFIKCGEVPTTLLEDNQHQIYGWLREAKAARDAAVRFHELTNPQVLYDSRGERVGCLAADRECGWPVPNLLDHSKVIVSKADQVLGKELVLLCSLHDDCRYERRVRMVSCKPVRVFVQ